MNKPLLKKEIAAAAGITPRTMRNNPDKWKWLARCRTSATRRPTYNARKVDAELRRRKII